MTFLAPLALIGLVLTVPIIVLHLRRRRRRLIDVPSLLIWRDLLSDTLTNEDRFSLFFSWLLLLQILAVAVLVFALARPQGAPGPRPQQIYVLDDSYRMAATDVQPTRMAQARQVIAQRIAHAPSSTLFTVVVASAQPYVLITSTDRTQVLRHLSTVVPSPSTADLAGGIRLAAGAVLDPHGRQTSLLVVYARGDTLPPVSGTLGAFSTLVVGRSVRNVALVRLAARCTLASHPSCMAYAAVRNESRQPVGVPVVVEGGTTVLAESTLHLPAGSETGLSFPIPAGTRILHVYLASADVLPLDNEAWAVVPTAPHLQVTLVGAPAAVVPFHDALSALPGVTVHTLTPARYMHTPHSASDVLILDGWLPPGPLPAVPALVLIHPPRLPGGSVGAALADTSISGEDTTSALLANVDLTSLDIHAGAATSLVLPGGIAPVVWSASGPLLAAGSLGGRQVALFSFDPSRSDLPQLNAFPVLLQNILQWSAAWLPTSDVAGRALSIGVPPGTSTILVQGSGTAGSPPVRQSLQPLPHQPTVLVMPRPGLYTVSEHGSWGSRSGLVAVNLGVGTPSRPPGMPVQFGFDGSVRGPGPSGSVVQHPWWPWTGLIALLLIVTEWLYVAARTEGV